MYTVFWQEEGIDKWDRLETEEEVKVLLASLNASGTVCIGDVWVFTPEADNFAVDGANYI